MPVFHAGFAQGGAPVRVHFGRGARRSLDRELDALSLSRAFVLTTPQQVREGEDIVQTLGPRAVGLFTDATMHTPVEVTERALETLRATGADCVVALGGGSTTGLGKALALRTGVSQVVVPTTYAGSEATPILGQTENGIKTTCRGPEILPEVIVYDVDLTMTLPVGLTVTSGLNALAHSAEGLYSPDINPVIADENGVVATPPSLS